MKRVRLDDTSKVPISHEVSRVIIEKLMLPRELFGSVFGSVQPYGVKIYINYWNGFVPNEQNLISSIKIQVTEIR